MKKMEALHNSKSNLAYIQVTNIPGYVNIHVYLFLWIIYYKHLDNISYLKKKYSILFIPE
jgi:hypothetical protein